MAAISEPHKYSSSTESTVWDRDGSSEHPRARLQHLAHSGLCGRPESGVKSHSPGAGQDVAVVPSTAESL